MPAAYYLHKKIKSDLHHIVFIIYFNLLASYGKAVSNLVAACLYDGLTIIFTDDGNFLLYVLPVKCPLMTSFGTHPSLEAHPPPPLQRVRGVSALHYLHYRDKELMWHDLHLCRANSIFWTRALSIPLPHSFVFPQIQEAEESISSSSSGLSTSHSSNPDLVNEDNGKGEVTFHLV